MLTWLFHSSIMLIFLYISVVLFNFIYIILCNIVSYFVIYTVFFAIYLDSRAQQLFYVSRI